MRQRVDTVVVGAGAAGLAASEALAAAGVDHVVLERGRVGETWRSQRWDSFRLNSLGAMSGLPGDPLGFATAGDLVAAFERRAAALPVREQVAVESVRRSPGGYLVSTSEGTLLADRVIAASGAQRVPRTPGLAAHLPGADHLHAADYRRPDALGDGAVLVVGCGQSGVQIATELVEAGRRVYVSTSRVGRVPRRYRGRDITLWLDAMGFYAERAEVVAADVREASQAQIGAGRTLSLQGLDRAGAVLLGRLTGADGARARFAGDLGENVRHADRASEQLKRRIDAWIEAHGVDAAADDEALGHTEAPLGPLHAPAALDLRREGITTVLWATGFGADFGWLSLPIRDGAGLPIHRGGVTPSPGLYVVGLPWQTHRASGILHGMPADARRVVAHLATRAVRRRAA